MPAQRQSIFDINLSTRTRHCTSRIYHVSRRFAFYTNNDVSFIFRLYRGNYKDLNNVYKYQIFFFFYYGRGARTVGVPCFYRINKIMNEIITSIHYVPKASKKYFRMQ